MITNKEQLRNKLKGVKCWTLVEVASEIGVSYQTIRGWSSKRPEYYQIVLTHLASYYTTYLNETDKSKMANALLTKLINKQLDLQDDTNHNNINIITNPIKEIGWNDEK